MDQLSFSTICNSTQERLWAITEQRKICAANGMPGLFPAMGYCHCGADLVETYGVEYLKKGMVTGCRKCHRSYID